jgi:riboflavin kinase/FMN adenylyltransferase
MEHLDSLTLARPDYPTCLTIGAFDGVHRGHQRVIERLLATAGSNRYRTAALTFFPLPRQVLGIPQLHFYLTAPKERARLLHQLGIELVITHPFNEQVRAIRAADFVELFVERLNVKEIWVGEDFALGYQREGDLPFLRAQGKIRGFVVRTVDFFAVEETAVSSSLIRRALKGGRVRDANGYLGRPFSLPGRVVKGDGRGRQIGFPTANLKIWDEQAYPARGVYAAYALVGGSSYSAAVNIGLRPTLTAGVQTVIEAHLVDFAGDLYGMEITLDFVARLRDEKKFSHLEQLVAQLQRDVASVRQLLGSQIGSELAGA